MRKLTHTPVSISATLFLITIFFSEQSTLFGKIVLTYMSRIHSGFFSEVTDNIVLI